MKYTETHEWISVKDGVGTVGITQFAQKELGDIVYIELPKVGKQVKKGEEAVVLESTKAAADVYSPVTGVISAVNTELGETPDLVNKDPEIRGWLYKLLLSNEKELTELLDKPTSDVI